MKLLCLSLCAGLAMPSWAQSAPEPTPERRRELIRLVRQDCGSCHGMTLKGGLGLPLLPDSLRGKSTEGLVTTVVQGRHGTPMPPWKVILREGEAEWIVAQLMAGFPGE